MYNKKNAGVFNLKQGNSYNPNQLSFVAIGS